MHRAAVPDRCGKDMRQLLDGCAVFLQTEAATGKDFLLAASVQVGEPARELDFFAIDGDRAAGKLSFCAWAFGHVA